MRIDRIEPSGRRILLHLEDGSKVAVTEQELLDFGLYSGIELEEENLRALKAAGRAGQTFARAAAMLGRRALSRRELIRKLTEKDALPEDAEQAADRLEQLGVIDDASYAAAVVRQYAARGWGQKKLQNELRRRGIDRALWDEALQGAPPPEETIDTLLQRRLGGTEADWKDYRRAADALYRRGYSWDDIDAGIRRHKEGRAGSDR